MAYQHKQRDFSYLGWRHVMSLSNCLSLVVLFLNPLFGQSDFWQPVNCPYTGTVYVSAVSPSGDIYVAGNDFFDRSTDKGVSWTAMTGAYNELVTVLAINATGDIFQGTSSHGIYRSTDNGLTWTHVDSG